MTLSFFESAPCNFTVGIPGLYGFRPLPWDLAGPSGHPRPNRRGGGLLMTLREPTNCSLCPWSQVFPDAITAARKLTAHRQLRHGEPAPAPLAEPVIPLGQLAYPAFQEAYTRAVRDLPVGAEYTTADLHGSVPEPLDHHYWGRAQTHVAHLGLSKEISRQPSELGTTKSSLVRRWVRTDPAAKGRTA